MWTTDQKVGGSDPPSARVRRNKFPQVTSRSPRRNSLLGVSLTPVSSMMKSVRLHAATQAQLGYAATAARQSGSLRINHCGRELCRGDAAVPGYAATSTRMLVVQVTPGIAPRQRAPRPGWWLAVTGAPSRWRSPAPSPLEWRSLGLLIFVSIAIGQVPCACARTSSRSRSAACSSWRSARWPARSSAAWHRIAEMLLGAAVGIAGQPAVPCLGSPVPTPHAPLKDCPIHLVRRQPRRCRARLSWSHPVVTWGRPQRTWLDEARRITHDDIPLVGSALHAEEAPAQRPRRRYARRGSGATPGLEALEHSAGRLHLIDVPCAGRRDVRTHAARRRERRGRVTRARPDTSGDGRRDRRVRGSAQRGAKSPATSNASIPAAISRSVWASPSNTSSAFSASSSRRSRTSRRPSARYISRIGDRGVLERLEPLRSPGPRRPYRRRGR